MMPLLAALDRASDDATFETARAALVTLYEGPLKRPERARARGAPAERPARMISAPRTSERAMHARMAAGLAALLISLAAFEDARAQDRHGGFDAAERARLSQGQLVTRPHPPTQRDPWHGGVSFQVVDRPADEVWRALLDLDAYAHMLPGTDRTRDDGLEGGARLLYVRQSQMGVSAEYSLRLRHDGVTRRVEFELDRDRPHDVEDARGFAEIQPYQRTRTLVTWGVRVVLGMGAIEPMVRGLIEPWLLRVPTTMKEYLEGRGRDRYRE
jgi:carbon monoxide dehydrogenase subunit G